MRLFMCLSLRTWFVLVFSCAQAFAEAPSVIVRWDANPEPDIRGYSVYFSQIGAPELSVVSTRDTSVVIAGLVEGKSFTFYVTAWNSANLESDPSAPVTWFVNSVPSLLPIPNQTAEVGVTVAISAVASDPDPGQTLSFALLPGSPSDARIDPHGGVFTWTPSAKDAGTTKGFVVQVTDDGTPPQSARSVFTIAVSLPDSDGDGVPDWYERLAVQDPLNWSDGSCDADGDGLSNLAEFAAGTSPTDRNSALRILSVDPLDPDMSITFAAVAGKDYRVMRTRSIGGDLESVQAQPTRADRPTMTILDRGASLLPEIFYQVLVDSPVGSFGSAPYGFTTLRIAGPHGTELAMTAAGLSVTRPISYQGKIQTAETNAVTDRSANWNEGEFDPANGPSYLEITAGPHFGFRADIITSLKSQRKLILNRNCADLVPGEGYAIRPHWTLASLFGPSNEAGLGTALEKPADQVILINPHNQVWSVFYYQATGPAGPGWRSNLEPRSDQSAVKIDPGQGFIVCRSRPGDLAIRVFGRPETGVSFVEIAPGLNLVANLFGRDVPLAETGLFTGNPTGGLAGGSHETADRLLIRSGAGWDASYFSTSGPGGIGWRSATNAAQDTSTTIIAAGSSFWIERRYPSPFVWAVRHPKPWVQ